MRQLFYKQKEGSILHAAEGDGRRFDPSFKKEPLDNYDRRHLLPALKPLLEKGTKAHDRILRYRTDRRRSHAERGRGKCCAELKRKSAVAPIFPVKNGSSEIYSKFRPFNGFL